MAEQERDNRPAAYIEDGVAVYRASSVGLCEEALVALRMGVQPTMPPDWMLEKYEEGAEWEEFIVSQAVEQYSAVLESTQDRAIFPITSAIEVRGSTDGYMTLNSQYGAGIEAKKLGPRLFENWKKGLDYFFAHSPYYRDQLTVYMEALGCPFVYAVGEWDPEAKKVVAVHTELIEVPPGDIQAIRMKVLRVEGRARNGDLGNCDGKESWPCPVYFLHDEEERAEVDGNVAVDLAALGRTYHEAQQMESRGKKLKEEARNRLKEFLVSEGFVDEEGGEASAPEEVDGVRVTPYFSEYPRLDKDAMVADGIDVEQYTTRSRSLGIRVKVRD